MKNKLVILLVAGILSSCGYSHDDIVIAAEYGYFEGQKDALNGDVRIICVDSVKKEYVIAKSFWDPIPIPSKYNPMANPDNCLPLK